MTNETICNLVRAATADDVPQIVKAEAEIFYDAWNFSAVSSALDGPTQSILCLSLDGRLAAYLISSSIAGESEILRIAVMPDMRRRGLGKILLRKFIDNRLAVGDTDIFLEVRDSNDSAISLYESCGFVSYAVRRNYYKHPIEDARLMRLVLDI